MNAPKGAGKAEAGSVAGDCRACFLVLLLSLFGQCKNVAQSVAQRRNGADYDQHALVYRVVIIKKMVDAPGLEPGTR